MYAKDLSFDEDERGPYASFALAVDRRPLASSAGGVLGLLGDVDLGALLVGTGGLQGKADAGAQGVTAVHLRGFNLTPSAGGPRAPDPLKPGFGPSGGNKLLAVDL